MDKIQRSVEDLMGMVRGGQNNSCNCNNCNNQNMENDRNNGNTKNTSANEIYYCWSHGVTHGDWYQSHNCTNQATGHKTDVAVLNFMGGSTK
eukprot:12831807-Ditylum_brightwellii.AAC.2